jgi:hypothetical protein
LATRFDLTWEILTSARVSSTKQSVLEYTRAPPSRTETESSSENLDRRMAVEPLKLQLRSASRARVAPLIAAYLMS